MLTRRIRIQFAVFAVIALTAISAVLFGYLKIQSTIFGFNRYTVTVQLPQAGGLYAGGNVTYRGVTVGRVREIRLNNTGAEAVLQMNSDVEIPATGVTAEVHSVSAVGEQYVALTPRGRGGPKLKDGDVIPVSQTKVPTDINSLVAAANRGLQAIPRENLKTVVDESYIAFGGLGPELSRLINGTTNLAIDARKNLEALTVLIDQSKPVLDSQVESRDSVQAWAANLADVTKQLQANDSALQGVINKGAASAEETRQLFDRLQPTLPIVLANLVSVGDVGVAYRADLEQLLVVLPAATAQGQATLLPGRNIKGSYPGLNLSFNLNLNLPPACTTGYLPPQQMRSPTFEDHPDRPAGDLYCRIPQDSPLNVRGARNYPCETRPGKRAPTVKMCESNEEYVPLNDGYNWKGDPNGTYSGQDIPQLPPGVLPPVAAGAPAPAAPPQAPIAIAEYDPATGTYLGPDGQIYRQTDLAQPHNQERTWQQMLMPPATN
ncbi:MCE family protein [Mycobacterium vicinigordonae]|uniref:MCE family protein n=1 Tax=Mycobacterium vicinigordonae TaxID=1719132 RepID=A0A7D6I8Q4_9MYCO|nr:MlaD family protein [Mycobacterium vicinigordonae]QLL09838.1 MCE family protein [Mycobacterium vicinigordonae]